MLSSFGLKLGWNFHWVMFCYEGKGDCNSWKDPGCLAAGEVWRTNSFKTMFPVCALCSSCDLGRILHRTHSVPVCCLWDHPQSRGGILEIFPYGSREWAKYLYLLPLLFISVADMFYKAVLSLLLFQFPCSLWISVIPTAWAAAAAGTNILLTASWRSHSTPLSFPHPLLLNLSAGFKHQGCFYNTFFSPECFKWSNRYMDRLLIPQV